MRGRFVVLLFVAIPCLAATRDWHQNPAVLQQALPTTLYVLGDIHGDDDTLVTLLSGTHLLSHTSSAEHSPGTARWSAGVATLLITGDVIDKYDQQLPVIALLRTMQAQAAAAGGQVIVTMGNHEAEFLAGDRPTGDFAHELQQAHIDPAAVIAGTDPAGIGAWMRNLPIAAKLGDWFFCHAGNTHGMTVSQLEAAAEEDITAHGFGAALLSDPDSLLEARMHPRPWWDYDGGTVELKETRAEKKADERAGTDPGQARLLHDLQQLGVHHLVFGHQPGEIKFLDGTRRPAGAVYQKWDNTVILIDTGMSRGVASGRGAVLRIEDGQVTVLYADGSSTPLPPH